MSTSPGLRSRQKFERRKRILNAARELFLDRGYSSSTIKDIAELASVSPPTVHKYYGTKQKLLFDLLVNEDIYELKSSLSDIETTNPPVAVAEFLSTIVDEALMRVDKKTWIYAFRIFETSQEISGTCALNAHFSSRYDQLENLFDKFKKQGELVSNIDIPRTREILELVNQMLFKMLLTEEIDHHDYLQKIRSYTDYMFSFTKKTAHN